jgi:hypothetical protein
MLAEVFKNRYIIASAALFPFAVMVILLAGGRDNFRLPWLKGSANPELSGPDTIALMRESLAQNRRELAQFEREQSTIAC